MVPRIEDNGTIAHDVIGRCVCQNNTKVVLVLARLFQTHIMGSGHELQRGEGEGAGRFEGSHSNMLLRTKCCFP